MPHSNFISSFFPPLINTERHYYLLDYEIRRDESFLPGICSTQTYPLPKKVLITNFKIPRVFDRINITVRYNPTELNYYRYHLWALRPDENITDLVYRHISGSGLFNKVAFDYIDESPDLEMRGEIQSIERYYYKGEEVSNFSAHLKMTLELYDYNKVQPLVVHSFDREEKLYQEDMNHFVLEISDIVKEETNNFIKKIVEYYCPRDSLHETQ